MLTMCCYTRSMKRPTKFFSDCFEWTIYWSKEKADEMFGKTDTATKTITIYACESRQIERETLFHELLHVALDDKAEAIFGFEPTDAKSYDKEENLIRLLSPAFMEILTRTPDLARYLFGKNG